MRVVLGLGLAVMAAAAPVGAASPADPHEFGVAEIRFQRMTRGINTSHWLAQVFDPAGYTPEHYRRHTTAEDIRLIRELGFNHVRLSVEPRPLFDPEFPDRLPAEALAELDRAIRLILHEQLAVIVDIHAFGDFVERLNDDDEHVDHVARFWRALAAHLSRFDPGWVFLEPLNEPHVMTAKRWNAVIRRIAAAAREGAPEHTLIISGHAWSGLQELLALDPLDDSNVVYNFHFYDPGIFTHQGANWAWHVWEHTRGVPYPSTPQNVAPVIERTENAAAREALRQYGEQRWDAEKIESKIAQAAAWARERGVRLTCNEFGVYTAYSSPEDRASWIRDARQALEKRGIGWAMWDYSGGFAVVRKRGGQAEPIPEIVEALGLRAPAP